MSSNVTEADFALPRRFLPVPAGGDDAVLACSRRRRWWGACVQDAPGRSPGDVRHQPVGCLKAEVLHQLHPALQDSAWKAALRPASEYPSEGRVHELLTPVLMARMAPDVRGESSWSAHVIVAPVCGRKTSASCSIGSRTRAPTSRRGWRTRRDDVARRRWPSRFAKAVAPVPLGADAVLVDMKRSVIPDAAADGTRFRARSSSAGRSAA